MSQTRPSKREAERRRGFAVALAIVVAGGAVCASPAGAWEIYTGEKLSATLDSTFTFGAAWRVEDRNYDQIFLGNDPSDRSLGTDQPVFSNSDDGNLNYKKGELYSTSVKGTFDLELDYRHGGDYLQNVAVFSRATAFYDFVGDDEDYTWRTPLDEDARRTSSVIYGGVVGAQWLFLDAYVQGTWELADRMMDLRVGNQVLSWGETIFTPGGINSINAFDVTKLRIPGSELKEALVPAPMVRVSGQILKNLGIEGYYQFHWNRTYIDPTGSYWATNDLVGRAAVAQYPANDAGSGCFVDPTGCSIWNFLPVAPRLSDVEPSNQGQGGVALRYYWDRILTEFGAYYIRYHSKTPTVGSEATNFGAPFFALPTAYFREYGDKIDVVAASFATEVLGATFAGEISYRWDDPTPIVAAGRARLAAENPGDVGRASGAVREKRLQAALNLIQTFGPSTRWGVGRVVEFLGADSVSLTSEMAVLYYPDLSNQCVNPTTIPDPRNAPGCVPYAGTGVADHWEGFLAPGTIERSRVNATSLGYQLFVRGEYTNPFGVPITLNPTVGWRHDFHGTSPNQTFVEDRMAIVFGLEVDYLRRWGGNITYASFFGAEDRNLGKDRDFVSLSVSYAF